MRYDDAMITNSFAPKSPEERRGTVANDQLINIDNDVGAPAFGHSSPPTPRNESYDFDQRRHTIALPAEEDVCFPVEGMSTIGEDYDINQDQGANYPQGQRRRRYKQLPDLSVLDEWRREEKEQRSEGVRAKKISEPVLVGGRLRPQKHGWHRAEEDAPYRFTYFNEEFPSTIHSQTISELVQEGQDFRELFIPDPPELSDDSSDEEDVISHQGTAREELSVNMQSRAGTRHSSIMGGIKTQSPEQSGEATPSHFDGNAQKERPKRYGDRPTFWLDVLSPTDTEMKILSKTFGIHPLTAEDILIQEAREKVELFKNYYFVNYRTFEQDMYSEKFLEPVNMYVVVFREGVISFHFSMTPHPANVRRRIRQLKDYLILSSDWISYAIIDDITDVFGPLIQSIEEEVDDIDDAILKLHTANKDASDNERTKPPKNSEGKSEAGEQVSSGGDMLRRVGEGRKKVMGLYRLLGNKADVIKGFAKRCNEHWDIAPRSEIGLYLGDIQDHILTMTSNLNHYETYVYSYNVINTSADSCVGCCLGLIPIISLRSTSV
jgi:magnesium transporter